MRHISEFQKILDFSYIRIVLSIHVTLWFNVYLEIIRSMLSGYLKSRPPSKLWRVSQLNYSEFTVVERARLNVRGSEW